MCVRETSGVCQREREVRASSSRNSSAAAARARASPSPPVPKAARPRRPQVLICNLSTLLPLAFLNLIPEHDPGAADAAADGRPAEAGGEAGRVSSGLV